MHSTPSSVVLEEMSWTMEAVTLQSDAQHLWSAHINHFFFYAKKWTCIRRKRRRRKSPPEEQIIYVSIYFHQNTILVIVAVVFILHHQKDHDFWDCLINYFIKVVKKLDVTWTKASIILQYTGSVIAIIIIITVMIRLYDFEPFSSL